MTGRHDVPRPGNLIDIFNEVLALATASVTLSDMAEANLPPEIVHQVSLTGAEWATRKAGPLIAAVLAFQLGLLVGVAWARAGRSR
jgi:hypothetical protein